MQADEAALLGRLICLFYFFFTETGKNYGQSSLLGMLM